MLWPILGALFATSLLLIFLLVVAILLKLKFWKKNKAIITKLYLTWFTPYLTFILFFTGPTDIHSYPSQEIAMYKLPWKAGVSRFVGQGNRSFTSHRGLNFYAWDFVMQNGTEILAARQGLVSEIEDSFDGIGFNSNFIIIQHQDGQHSGYFHIQRHGSLVKIGDIVKQGQPIALSGMVGQTIYPHVHFVVFNGEGTTSVPISFAEVPGGYPWAGHFYKSQNYGQ